MAAASQSSIVGSCALWCGDIGIVRAGPAGVTSVAVGTGIFGCGVSSVYFSNTPSVVAAFVVAGSGGHAQTSVLPSAVLTCTSPLGSSCKSSCVCSSPLAAPPSSAMSTCPARSAILNTRSAKLAGSRTSLTTIALSLVLPMVISANALVPCRKNASCFSTPLFPMFVPSLSW
jgi:hypothetical protein